MTSIKPLSPSSKLQDENAVFLVGESKGDIVGFIIATTRVDVKTYIEMYDLSLYNYFLPEDLDIESKVKWWWGKANKQKTAEYIVSHKKKGLITVFFF